MSKSHLLEIALFRPKAGHLWVPECAQKLTKLYRCQKPRFFFFHTSKTIYLLELVLLGLLETSTADQFHLDR